MNKVSRLQPHLVASLSALALLGILSTALQAAGVPDGPQDDMYIGVWGAPTKPGWTTRLGIEALSLPAYEGAKNYLTLPVPSFEVDYNDRLYANIWSVTYAVFQNKWISIGPELTPYLARRESYSDALKGTGDLPFDIKGGAFMGLHTPLGSLAVEASRTMTTSIGTTGSISFQSGYVSQDKRFVLNVTPGVTWADNDYMQNNFGITPSQSANSGYSVYSPKACFYNYFLYVAPTFRIGARHYIIPSVAYIREFGQASDSPLITGPGTDNQFIGQLAYQYLF